MNILRFVSFGVSLALCICGGCTYEEYSPHIIGETMTPIVEDIQDEPPTPIYDFMSGIRPVGEVLPPTEYSNGMNNFYFDEYMVNSIITDTEYLEWYDLCIENRSLPFCDRDYGEPTEIFIIKYNNDTRKIGYSVSIASVGIAYGVPCNWQ